MTDSGGSAAGACPGPLRVAYVTQWFPPEPVTVPLWIAQALRRQGLDVGVLTGIPNFPSGQVHPGYTPWRGTRDKVDGFTVVRAPLYPNHDRSAVRRAANYISFAGGATVWGRRLLRSADVALVYSSPATAAIAPMLNRVPYVLLVQDLWPDSVFATGFLTGGRTRRVAESGLSWFTGKTYDRAAHIAVTSPGMRELLVDRGVPEHKVSVVYNWVDESVMRVAPPDHSIRAELGLQDAFVLMYAGNHGPAQDLEPVVRAMEQVRDLTDVHLVLIGDGIDKVALQSLAARSDAGNIHFVPPVPATSMAGIAASADVQLVTLADQQLFRITLPSKVQSILACGRPVLSSAPGDAGAIVRRSGVGIAVPPGNVDDLASAIRELRGTPSDALARMGEAGARFYADTLSEASNATRLAGLLRAAAHTRKDFPRG